jgi:hypothetical protein
VLAQFLLDPFQGVSAHNHIHRPIRSDYQQSGRLASLRNGGEPVQRGSVAPL